MSQLGAATFHPAAWGKSVIGEVGVPGLLNGPRPEMWTGPIKPDFTFTRDTNIPNRSVKVVYLEIGSRVCFYQVPTTTSLGKLKEEDS